MTADAIILAQLCNALRSRRRAREWTQAQVAERARVSVTTVCRLEAGGDDINLGNYCKVAAALEILFQPKQREAE